MKSKIIKIKNVSYGTVKLCESQNESGVIVGYSVVKEFLEKNVIGGGAAKIEETPLLKKEEAENFFNSQN